MLEIKEAFQTVDFPVLDALHTVDPRHISDPDDSAHLNYINLLYDWYVENKVDVFEGYQRVACSIRGGIQRIRFTHYSLERRSKAIGKRAESELEKLKTKKKSLARDVKDCQAKVKKLHKRIARPVTPEIANDMCCEVFPNITKTRIDNYLSWKRSGC